MKKIIRPLALCLLILLKIQGFAQNDSTKISTSIKLASDSSLNANDTIKIGNLLIVKKQKDRDDNKSRKETFMSTNKDSVQVGSLMIVTNKEAKKPNFKTIIKMGDAAYGRPIDSSEYVWYKGEFKKTKFEFTQESKKLKSISTNWFSFDLGYTNFQDKSPELLYIQTIQSPNDVRPYNLKLNNNKSSNFNLWIVQQKVSLYQNKLNLKYGVGFEMFNFRLEQPVSFRNDIPNNMILDDVNFSKNKLFAKYLTVPFQLNFKSDPKNKKSFYMSMGMSAGYLVDARNKQKSNERGKQKYNGNFNLSNWRLASIGELGIGGIRLYGSYGLTNLFDKIAAPFEFYPYTIGLRFSNF